MVGGNRAAARLAAPAAFLAAVTVAVLIVRDAVRDDTPAVATTAPAETQAPATTQEPPATTAAPPPTTAPATTAAPTTTAEPEAEFYTVESGDTLETIATEYSTSVEQLLVLNPDVDPVAMQVGDQIRVR